MKRRLAFVFPTAFALMLAAGFCATPAEAGRRVQPQWCVIAYDGAPECFYYTFQQCLEAVWGTGGSCHVNPRFTGYPPEPVRSRKRPRYQ
jgi:hypothetical protein